MSQRDYKKFGRGCYYHIYNRGNGKKEIFLDEQDYGVFLQRLRFNVFPDDLNSERLKGRLKILPPDSFSIISYCLMPNHFHLLLRQDGDIPPNKLLLKVCTSYSMFFNKKYKHVGHVFQNRFRQIFIDDNKYLTWLVGYIHSNPVTAGLVKNPLQYVWSSHREYCRKANFNMCHKNVILDQFKSLGNFQSFVNSSSKIIKNKKDLEQFLIDHED